MINALAYLFFESSQTYQQKLDYGGKVLCAPNTLAYCAKPSKVLKQWFVECLASLAISANKEEEDLSHFFGGIKMPKTPRWVLTKLFEIIF